MKKRKQLADRIRQAGMMFTLLIVLCGCTKKEEILLLSGENAAGTSDGQSVIREDAGGHTAPETETGRTAAEESRQVQDGESQGTEAESVLVDAVNPQAGVIYVHVCGAVENPGVYELEAGSRVYEAVQQAGGFADSAEQNYVNQAQVLEDGVKLVIPTREEVAAAQDDASEESDALQDRAQDGSGIAGGAEREIGIVGGARSDGQGGDAAPDGRININTASEAQLCEIPGIGATRAAAIAAYRESHGAFGKPEDIMNVNGIKEGMYEKIKDIICVK